MSEASTRSDLRRQNARDEEEFAKITVAEEIEMEERSEALPLLPHTVSFRRLESEPASVHRRNRSQDMREEGGYRKSSDQTAMASGTEEAFQKKKLSEARGVNLEPICMERDLGDEFPQIRQFVSRSEKAPPRTSSPITHHLFSNTALSRSGDDSTEITILIFFADPHVSLAAPYKACDFPPRTRFLPLEHTVDGGRHARASFLLDEVAREYGLNEELARDALSVWMESDLLEVQLKPHHSPYEIMQFWGTFLQKFTATPEEDIMDDSPRIVIKRKVQLSIRREKEIIDGCTMIRELLFNDAYVSFMLGRYCIDPVEAVRMAGEAMATVFEPFDEEKHTIDFLRSELDHFLPPHLVSLMRGTLFFGRALLGPNNLETAFLKSWKDAPRNVDEIHRRFLQQLHDKPFYGAAFFPGFIEKPKKKWSFSSGADVEVLVGVNHSFVTVLDETKRELLLVQRIEDCTWKRIDIEESLMSTGVEPSLLLHFPDDTEKKKGSSTKMLQIFGRQAVMMDAILRAMLARVKEREEHDSGAEMSDSAMPDNGASVASRSLPVPCPVDRAHSSSISSSGSPPTDFSSTSSRPSATVSRMNSLTRSTRLCLATFDSQGKCIHAQGSLKAVLRGERIAV